MLTKTLNIINNIFLKFQIYKYNLLGSKIHSSVKIFGKFLVLSPENLRISKNTSINQGVLINCRAGIIIGKNVHISPYVQIHAGKLTFNKDKKKHTQQKIVIEDNVWIASGAVISSGVRIGRNSIIGANSVVLNNVEPNSFYAGIPAKKISNL